MYIKRSAVYDQTSAWLETNLTALPPILVTWDVTWDNVQPGQRLQGYGAGVSWGMKTDQKKSLRVTVCSASESAKNEISQGIEPDLPPLTAWVMARHFELYYCLWYFNKYIDMHWSFKARWLLCVPPGLTSSNPTFCPHCIYVFCVDLRTNSDYFPIHH
jgi:hypothetical protein